MASQTTNAKAVEPKEDIPETDDVPETYLVLYAEKIRCDSAQRLANATSEKYSRQRQGRKQQTPEEASLGEKIWRAEVDANKACLQADKALNDYLRSRRSK